MEDSEHTPVFNKNQSRNPTKCKPEMGFKISKNKKRKKKERGEGENEESSYWNSLLYCLYIILFLP